MLGSIKKLLLATTLTQAWIYTDYWGIGNSAAWFISTIFFCYILTPFLIHYLSFIRRAWSYIYVITGLYMLCIVLVYIWKVLGWEDTALYITPLMRLPEYTIGICSGYIVRKINNIRLIKGSRHLCTIAEILCSTLVVFNYIFIMKNNYNFDRIADIFAIPVLLFMIIVFSLSDGEISRVLSSKIHKYLGSISLYIYLLHYLVIHFGGKQILSRLFGTSTMAIILNCFALFGITLGLSIIYDRLIIHRRIGITLYEKKE